MQTPAERIKKGLESTGIYPAELARRLRVTHQAVASFLSGTTPGRKHFSAIAEMTGATVEWLTNGTGPAPTWASAAPPPPSAPIPVSLGQEIHEELLTLRNELMRRLSAIEARLGMRPDEDPGQPIAELTSSAISRHLLEPATSVRPGG